MITQKELQKIIDSTKIINSKPRTKYLNEIRPWLEEKEIIILKGIRRCGKTHIMHQLMKTLPEENTFYIDFEDFRLDKFLGVDLLEKIMKLRDKSKKVYFFLDEIQKVQGFEKWLRTYYDREEQIKFIIGGSNISLLTPKLSTVLTGRNITFKIYPLDYDEFQTFSDAPLETYMKFGGFPEVVLANEEAIKRKRLEQYVDDIVTKDIIEKYKLANITQLKALVKFFLNNPGVKISASKLGRQLSISKNSAQKYIEYIKDTFLIFEVPYFLYSAKTKYIASQAPKYYCMDNGFHTITATKSNQGALLENVVAIKLQQTKKELFYWQDKVEIDFVTNEEAIQVTSTKDIPQRETKAFADFGARYNKVSKFILINPEKSGKKGNIEFVKTKDFLKR